MSYDDYMLMKAKYLNLKRKLQRGGSSRTVTVTEEPSGSESGAAAASSGLPEWIHVSEPEERRPPISVRESITIGTVDVSGSTNQMMIDNNHGYVYDGGTKKDFGSKK
jgi:hypothetical protein